MLGLPTRIADGIRAGEIPHDADPVRIAHGLKIDPSRVLYADIAEAAVLARAALRAPLPLAAAPA